MTRATKRELERVTIRVMGRYFMNSPTIPVQNRRGLKAARVVKVEAMTGRATSPVALRAASDRSQPSST